MVKWIKAAIAGLGRWFSLDDHDFETRIMREYRKNPEAYPELSGIVQKYASHLAFVVRIDHERLPLKYLVEQYLPIIVTSDKKTMPALSRDENETL